MTLLWRAKEAAIATGGQLQGDWAGVSGVSIDSRTLAPGDLFVALTAARDGHDFVADALRRGAGAAMVTHRPAGVSATAPLLIVPDVLAGLHALAQAARARTQARVVAVTGSVGKTSTKEMLRAVLGGQGRVHAAEASLNNHWGVPLTLARLPAEASFAVIEIGMSAEGEIAPLARLAQPDLIMITTIAPAHLEALGSLAAIAREKASICDGLVPGGVAVLPAGLDQSAILDAAATGAGARIVHFGPDADADWRLGTVRTLPDASIAQADGPTGALLYKVMAPGAHFAANALGVLAVAAELGCDLALAVGDLARWRPPAGRGSQRRVLLDPLEPMLSFDLIDDAFNANPASMAAAVAVLGTSAPRDGVGRLHRGRRIAILGDMLELGPDETALHSALAHCPGFDRIDVVHCVGPRMAALWQALPPRQRGEHAALASDLAARVHHLVDAGDVVLVKGSKGSKVSAVAEALARMGPDVAARTEDEG